MLNPGADVQEPPSCPRSRPQPLAEAVALSETSKFRAIDPQAVALGQGGFFSVWENMNEGLWGRAVAADGQAAGPQRLLVANSPRPSNPGEGWWVHNSGPSVAPLANGGFLLAWTREVTYLRNAAFQYTSSPLRRDLYVQRFAADGTALAAERRVNADSDLLNSLPLVVAQGPSRFLVVWQRDGEDGGLRARVLAANGRPIGAQLNVAGPGSRHAAVAVNHHGDALIAWTAADADETGVFARLFDRTMMPVGDAFRVNGEQALAQSLPRVAAGADGSFLVSWWTRVGTSGNYRSAAQLVTLAGALAGGERLIGDEWDTTNLAPNVVALPGGGYANVWMIWNGWYASGLFAEVLDAIGDPVGTPIRVSDSRPIGAHHFGLAVDGAGTLFVAWEGFNGRERGIRGRAFAPPAP
jgi:hypothetical protein